MAEGSSGAIFIDRDGVVNRRRIGDYVKRWEEFEFLPGIFDVLPEIHRLGLLAVLITNQRGIGRGLMSEEDLAEIHASMSRELRERTGHDFDGMYHCPHDRDEGCDCRKPKPGMLVRAAADLEINPKDSWMIGDSESDIEAGIAAGCGGTVRIGSPDTDTSADALVADLKQAWAYIVGRLGRT